MPGINYKKHFAPMVLSGRKPFTLRALRKDGRDPQIGQTLYMFTEQRSKNCKKFAEKPCKFTVTIRLCYCWIWIPGFLALILPDQLESFSKLDGFDSYAEFCEFHKIKDGMKTKEIRLIAWVTRDELKALLNLQEQ